MNKRRFAEISKSFFVDTDYRAGLEELGLTSIDTVFSFNAGMNLVKNNLAKHRSRLQFKINSPPVTVFLKRYDKPPILLQLKNWLLHRSRKSTSFFDVDPANKLAENGINTPKTICYGEQWGSFFEKRSFCITEKIPNAESLERKLPDCFNEPATGKNIELRKNFIVQLANFVRKFHETNCRHQDLYFAHIFYGNSGRFYLIDLARAFKPVILAERYRIKDIAQLYYSAPAEYFSKSDRLRFYLSYTGHDSLTRKDKVFISKVKNKAKCMARHDRKHGRSVPFAGKGD